MRQLQLSPNDICINVRDRDSGDREVPKAQLPSPRREVDLALHAIMFWSYARYCMHWTLSTVGIKCRSMLNVKQ